MGNELTNCRVCDAPLGRCVHRFLDRGRYHYIRECSHALCRHLCLGEGLSAEERPAGGDHGAVRGGRPPAAAEWARFLAGRDLFAGLFDGRAGCPVAVAGVGTEHGAAWAVFCRAEGEVAREEADPAAFAEEISAVPVVSSLAELPPGETYDAAVLWRVLECAADPRGALLSLTEPLAEGGRLLARVPSYEHGDVFARSMRTGELFSAAHANYYTRFTLHHLFLRSGLFVEEVRADGGEGFLTAVAAVNRRLSALISAAQGADDRAAVPCGP
jgi:hypothetical protein